MFTRKFVAAAAVAFGVMCATLSWVAPASAHTVQDLQIVGDQITDRQQEISYYTGLLNDLGPQQQFAEQTWRDADDACSNTVNQEECRSEAYSTYLDSISSINMDADAYTATIAGLQVELAELQQEYYDIYHELYG